MDDLLAALGHAATGLADAARTAAARGWAEIETLLAAGDGGQKQEPGPPGELVRASVKYFDARGRYADGMSTETRRGPGLHALLAAWSDRPLHAEINIETVHRG